MRNECVKDFLKSNKNKMLIDSELKDAPLQLTFGDFIGEVYFSKPIGDQQRFVVKSAVHYLAAKSSKNPTSVNAGLRRFLKIRRVDDMNMGQFEYAIDYLMSLAR